MTGTKISPDLSNPSLMNAARWSQPGFQRSDIQFLECTGNIVSQLPFSQRGTSREQQMKFPAANKAYISNLDAFVASCRRGVPRSCRFQNLQNSSAAVGKRGATIGLHRGQNRTCAFLCKWELQVSGGSRDMRKTASKAYFRYICHACFERAIGIGKLGEGE